MNAPELSDESLFEWFRQGGGLSWFDGEALLRRARAAEERRDALAAALSVPAIDARKTAFLVFGRLRPGWFEGWCIRRDVKAWLDDAEGIPF